MSDTPADTGSSPQPELMSTHFQTSVPVGENHFVGVALAPGPDGELQFFLDQPISAGLFGPEQIMLVMARLNNLTTSLNKYVNDRIAEAKATIEKETQPELPLDQQPVGVSQEPAACEAGACGCGSRDDEDAPHAGQPE